MNLNKVFLVGNLTRDPELRQTASGQAVCSFGVATNRVFTDGAGQRQQQTEFHNVVAWARLGEIVHQYLRKGSLILVEGRIQTRNWQDPQGQQRYRTEVIAERIQLGPRGGGGSAPEHDTERQRDTPRRDQQQPDDTTPIIELPPDGEEIDVKDIPF